MNGLLESWRLDMDTPAPERSDSATPPPTRARRMGRRAAKRYPRLTAFALWLGRTLIAMAGVLVVFFVDYLLGAMLQKSKPMLATGGWIILGIFSVVLDWLGSLPGYVWLILFGWLFAVRILSQLKQLIERTEKLERRVAELKQAVEKGRSDGDVDESDFDDEDEW